MSSHPRPIDPRVMRLAELSEELGRQAYRCKLLSLGEIHCLSPDITESELVRVLAAGGLAVSTVDGIQLIHRLPRTAA